MQDHLGELTKHTAEWRILEDILTLAYWDSEVTMPPGGMERRSELLGYLSEKLATLHSADEIGVHLAALETEDQSKLSRTQQGLIRDARDVYDRARKIPPALEGELMTLATHTTVAWRAARARNEFSKFAPFLEQVLTIVRKKAELVNPAQDPYEVLLQSYDPSLTIELVDRLFAELRAGLEPLLAKIKASNVKVSERTFLETVPLETQQTFNKAIAHTLGLNEVKSRVDVSTHPMSFWMGDARITTRYGKDWWDPLGSTAHEAGHSLYEQNIDRTLPGCVANSSSLVIHEAQSRFMENHVFQSNAFTKYLAPRIAEAYNVRITADELYQTINQVKPSFIRVEADEVTYPFHVFLRYDIEKRLVRGELAVVDLPKAWNEGMHELLGVTPRTDTQGCLQDVHWCDGGFGYFPTYVLGSMFAAQIEFSMRRNVKVFDELLEVGDLERVNKWLAERIHKEGRTYSASDIVRRATGEPLQAKFLVDYLNHKYSDLYKL